MRTSIATQKNVRFGFAGLVALSGLLVAAPAAGEQHGYLVPVVGRVVSVDRTRGSIVLHHGMLETTSPGEERCIVPHRLLRFFRPGMELRAKADTSRRPWRLTEVEHFHTERRGPPPGDSRLAFRFDEVVRGRS